MKRFLALILSAWLALTAPALAQFGGASTITSIFPSYNALNITTNVTLAWPIPGQSGPLTVAAVMDVTATAGLTITMPTALNQAPGAVTLISNIGSNTFAVNDNSGNNLLNISAGQQYVIYLRTNTSQAGTWGQAQLASLTSAVSAGSLAGNGLTAIATLLNASLPVDDVATNFSIATTDRAHIKNWTGPGGTITLNSTATYGTGFFFGVGNGGSGPVILQPSGGQLINGSANLTLNTGGGSAIVFSDNASTQWVAIGTSGAFPTSLPPSGPATGDLSGSYPNPMVVNLHLGAPLSTGQGGTGNNTGQPSGTAGGDLTGNYPNPQVQTTHLASPLPPAQGGTLYFTGGTSTGAAAVQAVAVTTPTGWAHLPGYRLSYVAGFNSTTGLTLNIAGVGAVVVKKLTQSGLATIVANDQTAGQIYDVVDDGTFLELLNPSATAGGGAGTVTSVALAVPAELTVSGSPVTTSGTLTVTKATETANTVWAGPTTGAANTPTFRALVAADLPGGLASPATDIQTFTAVGANTWTKPGGYGTHSITHIECWGGGGSGGREGTAASAAGGGGGSYKDRFIAMSSLGATETVTVGAGGAALSSNGNGNSGGNTTFGAWLTGYGGGGGGGTGGSPLGGAGGGWFVQSAAATATNDIPTGEGLGATTTNPATSGFFTGGGGGTTAGGGLNGSPSVTAGGGGGGAGGSGGASSFGGAGGAGNTSSSNATSGSQPGGGGGGHTNNAGNSGAGGAGQCTITSTSG